MYRASILIAFPLLLATAFASAATPDIQHWRTPQGTGVYFVAAEEIPIIDVRVVYAAGSARDGGKPGIAQIVSDLLKEGAGPLDSNAFSDQLAATGAEFSTGALRDMAWIEMRSLSDPAYLDRSLALLDHVVSKPRFDADAIERVRAQALVGLKHDEQSPSKLAGRAFYQSAYGDHPYASPMPGTPQSVSAMTREDIVAFHRRYYNASNASIAIVGDVTREQAEKIALTLSDDMPQGDPAEPLPPVAPLAGASDHRIEFPSIQSHVRIGQPGLKRGDPDYFPLLVGNHVLGGGGLVSILFDEVREKRGLSYSVDSNFAPMAELGPFVASLQTDKSQEREAITVMRDEIRKFIADGPTEAALEAAKQNLIGGFPLRIDSNAKIAEYLAMIGFYGLPLDYLKAFPESVAKVTVDDVKDAFRRRLDPARMVTIVVGRSDPADG